MLQLLWNRIAYSGVSHASDISEHKHILLVNGLSLVISTFSILNVIVTLFVQKFSLLNIPPIVYAVLLLFTISLNSHGRLFAARMYFFFLSYVFISLYTILAGRLLPMHFFLLSEVLAVFFIFPLKEKKWMHALAFLLITTFSLFEILHKELPVFLVVPAGTPEQVVIIFNVSFGVLILAFAIYIHSIFQTAEKRIQTEQKKSETLLRNILPESIIKKLRENSDTIADRFEHCTVLFSDIVGFTEISRMMPASSVVSLLNDIFSAFDDLAEKHGLEKIKTIGDAYMVVGGLPEPVPEHAERVASFAMEMIMIMREYKTKYQLPLELRIGINSGDAVAGVIGKKKFVYDLWGDSVNTASRMESHGLPGQIQVTESTYTLLRDKFRFEERGSIEVKGLGRVKSYLLMEKTLQNA